MKVRDPDGQTWRVSRRWLPWRRRIRSADDLSGADPIPSIDDLAGLILVICLLVLAILAPFVLVAIVASVEFLLAVIFLPLAVLGRILFGRKWHVELRHGFARWTEVQAGDWQRSGIEIHRIADAVRRGDIPERTIPAVRWGRLVEPSD